MLKFSTGENILQKKETIDNLSSPDITDGAPIIKRSINNLSKEKNENTCP
jgi:uncharacterized protein YjgD (DUF1641 family)